MIWTLFLLLFWWAIALIIISGLFILFFAMVIAWGQYEQTHPSPYPNLSRNPPRWLRDPVGRHEWRWWNSSLWTEHVADDGLEGIDPLTDEDRAIVGWIDTPTEASPQQK